MNLVEVLLVVYAVSILNIILLGLVLRYESKKLKEER
jgi:hypothetical protein